ncbi:MAG: hypothetical protein ABI670_22190 [Chloroflexota bacterium]
MPGVTGNFSVWNESDCAVWRALLASYPAAIEAQGSSKLTNLDVWFRDELPAAIASRAEPCLYPDELQGIAAWKMSRGVWRERNRVLISGNSQQAVVEASRKAFVSVPDPRLPITALAALAGVGPATASAALAAFRPDIYPFFDEAVSGQIPGLGPVAFTTKYYLAYAQALRERAATLNAACGEPSMTPQDVAQAMWAAWALSGASKA